MPEEVGVGPAGEESSGGGARSCGGLGRAARGRLHHSDAHARGLAARARRRRRLRPRQRGPLRRGRRATGTCPSRHRSRRGGTSSRRPWARSGDSEAPRALLELEATTFGGALELPWVAGRPPRRMGSFFLFFSPILVMDFEMERYL
jgi:hypothetical protein